MAANDQRRVGPQPGAAGAAGPETDERVVQRTLMWLIVVPFTAPMWLSLHRRRPDLAEPIRWAAWFNVAQSVLVVVIVALAWWAIVALPSLVERTLAAYFGL